MKVFLKYFFNSLENDLNWVIYGNAIPGDFYNDGRRKYKRIKKGHDGKKWKVV
jgi:hypothetical protein